MNGAASADLPAAAGTIARPPAYACYLAFTLTGTTTVVWFQTGDQFNRNASCAIGNAGTSTSLRIAIVGGAAGQAYAIVAVY